MTDRQPRPPTPPAIPGREPIWVYVRKNDDDTRVLSFKPPRDLRQPDFIKLRVALDGNQAIWTVGPVDEPSGWFAGRFNTEPEATLIDALAAEQAALIAWAEARGYEVEFR